MERFGEKLHTLRNRRGLTTRQLANQLEVSSPYVVQMEHRQKIPNAAMIIKIARIFQVSTDSLMLDELDVD